MTQKANYHGATKFSQWLRNNDQLKSEYGFTTTDVDYIWSFKHRYMLIEEKCRMVYPKPYQCRLYDRINGNCWNDPDYMGLFVIQFEREYPGDGGKIFVNGRHISERMLTRFLSFDFAAKEYRFISRKPEFIIYGGENFANNTHI